MSAHMTITLRCNNDGCVAIFPEKGSDASYERAADARKDSREADWVTYRREGDTQGDICATCEAGRGPVTAPKEEIMVSNEHVEDLSDDPVDLGQLPDSDDDGDDLSDLL